MSPENQNPIQDENAEKLGPDFSPLAQAEHDGTAGDSGGDDIKNAEENPNGFKNNVTGTGGGGRGNNTSSTAGGGLGNKAVGNNTGPFNSKLSFSVLKKRGPLFTIILVLGVGGIGIGGLLSPGLLIVQMKEVMVNKFNTQFSSMDIRSTKMLANKSGILKGICTSPVSIKCRYGTMSEKQVANFKKAGIEVVSDGDTTLLGRIRPKKFKFEGQIIEANKFKTMIKINSKFRTALKHAYNPKFAGFADAIWVKAANILKISKKAPTFEGEDYDAKMKNLEKNIQDTTGLKKAGNVTDDDVDPNSPEGKTYGEEGTTEATNNKINELNTLIDESGGDGSTASKLLNGANDVGNIVKITGLVDDGCTVYRTFRSIGYAAKTVRVLQLAYYSMMFLNVADQIKAGTAKSEDVSFLGTVLTNTSADDNGNAKSAGDSFGYKYAAYGDLGNMPTSAMQFMAAAGLSGLMVNFFESFPKSLKTTCKFLANPVVGFASLVGGIALAVFSGGTSLEARGAIAAAKASLKAAAKEALTSPGFWASTGLGFAEMFLPGLLKDIVAGNLVDKSTVGANAGDAITSGASGIMGTVAKTGGNAPLTPTQAVAYSNLTNDIAAQYAEEDRLAYSPLDASNSNTFMGKIVSQLVPYTSNMSSLSGVFSSLASITTGSLASITSPTTKAASTNEYSMCQDYEYRKLNLATDPFCNVMYGIPPEALNADPMAVIDALSGQIDPETGDPIADSDYAKFVTNCIDRTTPLGDNSSESEGKECLFSDANKNYYIHYIDQRVQTGLDGEEVAPNTTTDPPGTTAGGTTPPSGTDRPDNVQSSGDGWILKDGVDYSNIACAPGTTDGGTYKHPMRKFTIRKCGTSLGPVASGEVSSLISQKFVDMVAAAKQDNIVLKGSGWRSYEEQKVLWDRCAPNCNGMVAQPGNSNHEKGLAIDFTHNGYRLTTADAEHKWLDKNAAKFGFINLSYEPWHWSTSGG